MIVEYALEHHKYYHEVLEEATPQDLAYFGALRYMRQKEENEARRRAQSKAKQRRR